jgi:short-subunit dehydrogenase
MVRRTALVTGATAGIGAAFARRLAADGYDLVLVARDGDRLDRVAKELTSEYGVAVETLPADLVTDEGCTAVADRLADRARPISMLVNNAGKSLNMSFLRSTVADQEQLLRLNVHAVMRLTHAALPGMVSRGHGAVVNVSSVAGWAVRAGSTYPASKAWVTSFSLSVDRAVRPDGVRVMALCPGYTHTEFHQRAGIDMSQLPERLWLDADQVVDAGLRDLRAGRSVSVPSWKYKVSVFGMRYLPRSLTARVAGSPKPTQER